MKRTVEQGRFKREKHIIVIDEDLNTSEELKEGDDSDDNQI